MVILVSGASSGIGAAVARLAAADGHDLVLSARSQDKLDALAKETGGLAVAGDVTVWADHERVVAAARERFGGVDVVFANAGVGDRGTLEDGDPDEWRQLVLTNVYGIALTIKAAIPLVRERRGHLLLTSSLAGRRALSGSIYSASKFAVTALGEASRLELNGTGARVTLIEPGRVESPGFHHEMDDPLVPEDIARAVMFAISQPPHVDVNEIVIRPTAQET